MGRPPACSCCDPCPDQAPLMCAAGSPPPTEGEAGNWHHNETGAEWFHETFSTTGIGFQYTFEKGTEFTDRTNRTFPALTTGAFELSMSVIPTGIPRWFCGVSFWPSDGSSYPAHLLDEDGPVISAGAPDAKFRWLPNCQNISQTGPARLFAGIAYKDTTGAIYLRPETISSSAEHGAYEDPCWQPLPISAANASPFDGDPAASQFRQGLFARDRSDGSIVRLPAYRFQAGPTGDRVHDRLYKLDPDGDLLLVDERPDPFDPVYDWGFWIGMCSVDLNQFIEPEDHAVGQWGKLGRGDGTTTTTAAALAVDNVCYQTETPGLYPTITSIDRTTFPPTYAHTYGRGAVETVWDDLTTVPPIGNAPGDRWTLHSYDGQNFPLGSASLKADRGFLTWEETKPGHIGHTPIAIQTDYEIPAAFWADPIYRVCIEWTWRETDHDTRNYWRPGPPDSAVYFNQKSGVGVPGLFGCEVVRRNGIHQYGIHLRTAGPTPYWLENGSPSSAPADWQGTYNTDGSFYSHHHDSHGGTIGKNLTGRSVRAPIPFDGSRIAVVLTRPANPLGTNQKYRLAIHVFVDGIRVKFDNENALDDSLCLMFQDSPVYLIGAEGGGWESLRITTTTT